VDLFDGPEAAQQAATDIERHCVRLVHVVEASINRARALADGEERMWADISRADWLFLTEPEPANGAASRRVSKAFRDAVPADHRFACDAVVNQLRLHTALGFRAGMAQGVIDTLLATHQAADGYA